MCDPLPIERTLGVQWCIESDVFQFRMEVKDKPFTRRGILSTVSSVFDPLGLVSPFVLIGKQVLQELVPDGRGWDDPIPEDLRSRWERWCHMLPELADIKVPRCYKDKELGTLAKVELHNFSDASLDGYGQCSYLRLVDTNGSISTALVMGKSRAAPSKPMTIPRLELTAAVVSVRISSFLQRELDYQTITSYYWMDSKVVLGYISNESKSFHIFVANRVQQIRDNTAVTAWNHVDTKENPADIASRGMGAKELLSATNWWMGPDFLRSASPLPLTSEHMPVGLEDPEVRRVTTHSSHTSPTFASLLDRIEYFSNWHCGSVSQIHRSAKCSVWLITRCRPIQM